MNESPNPLRNSTLVFLIKRSGEQISHICLAMKKRGFGMNRWNGAGGKVEGEETIEQAAKRETKEEIGVEANTLSKIAELSFFFPHNAAWNQLVHVYFCESWNGEPTESEEMRPEWFAVENIPFPDMWPDDIFWLPEALRGSLIRGTFTFGEKESIQSKDVQVVSNL